MTDLLIFLAYSVAVLVVGAVAHLKRGLDRTDFFLAGSRMTALPLGLSVMVTLFNAVNYSTFPAEVIANGLYVLVSVPVFLLVAWPVARWIIPFYRRQTDLSGYAWLEKRYDSGVRRTAAGLFLLWRLAWMATALFAVAQVLGPLTGLPPAFVMTGTIFLAVVYISWGGLRAVIWTDLLQFAVLFGGLIFAVFYTISLVPDGLFGIFVNCRSNGTLQPWIPLDPGFWDWNPSLRISFWSGLLGTFVAFLARYAADQMILQRYAAAGSLKEAQRSIWINAWAAMLVLLLLVLLGLAAKVIPAAHNQSAPAAQLAIFFRSLPTGLTGLIAAGLLAATMSSLDSGIHACCLTVSTDFSGKKLQLAPPVIVSFIGLLVLLTAMQLHHLGGLFAVVNKVINGLGAPLLGMILLAMRGHLVTAAGLRRGAIAGFVISVAVAVFVDELALHYYAVVNLLVTMLGCILFSLLPEKDVKR